MSSQLAWTEICEVKHSGLGGGWASREGASMLEERALRIEESWAKLVNRYEDGHREQGTECSSSLKIIYVFFFFFTISFSFFLSNLHPTWGLN